MRSCDRGHLTGSTTRDSPSQELAMGTRPAPGNRADADIIAELRARLAREAWTGNRGIRIDVREGTISLVGVVNSETEKAALATMAREVEGCKGIENHLLVKSKSRDYGVAY